MIKVKDVKGKEPALASSFHHDAESGDDESLSLEGEVLRDALVSFGDEQQPISHSFDGDSDKDP